MKMLLSRRLLLGSLLATLTCWLGGCRTRTAAPPQQPALSSVPQQEECRVEEDIGIMVIYTYDADGKCVRVQRSENRPAQQPDRIPDAP